METKKIKINNYQQPNYKDFNFLSNSPYTTLWSLLKEYFYEGLGKDAIFNLDFKTNGVRQDIPLGLMVIVGELKGLQLNSGNGEPVFNTEIKLRIDDNNSGSTRYDIVQVKSITYEEIFDSRYFKNPITREITNSRVPVKLRYKGNIVIKKGTPGDPPPTVDAGYMKLAEIEVGDGVTEIENADIELNPNNWQTEADIITYEPMPYGIIKEIYVADLNNHRIQKFNINGNFILKWGSFGTSDGQFNSPRDVSVYNNEVYVIEEINNRVQVFDLNGTYKRKWGSNGSGNGQFNFPRGIHVYNNEVYIMDTANNRVQVFNLNGTYQRQWGSFGTGDGQFATASDIFVYSNEAYVMDTINNRVQVFDLNGNYQRKWNIGSSAADSLVVYNNEVYISVWQNNKILVYNLNGTFQREWGSYGTGDGQFDGPRGIVEYNNEIYVTDTNNNRVQVFDLNGTYKRKWGSGGVGDGQFAKPYGITAFK